MSDFNVTYVANLARIELSEDEAARFQGQLDSILDYIRQLESVDVTGIEPTAHASPVFDVLREDVSRPGFTADEALLNAPSRTGDQFRVPKVIE
jgi:aspartyl-tRNA(Asn)/glutamyl-tRNA(Gln) amidotransferase subunit C